MPDGTVVNGPVIGIPQPFPLNPPLTRIEVATEATATLEVTAKTKSGKPVEGVNVFLFPNILRMNGIFGWMKHSSEEPFRTMNPLPELLYSGTTDGNGKAAIQNIPSIARGMEISHPQFEVPLEDPHGLPSRWIRLKLSPGTTNRLVVMLQPKGTDFIGTVR
jgi:hypothetical protein